MNGNAARVVVPEKVEIVVEVKQRTLEGNDDDGDDR